MDFLIKNNLDKILKLYEIEEGPLTYNSEFEEKRSYIVLGEKAKNKIIRYVPHGLNENLMRPITPEDSDWGKLQSFKNALVLKLLLE